MEGREFTAIILQNKFGQPVTIIPSEIEMTYHAAGNEIEPLAYLKTTLKFWVDEAHMNTEAVERILFSVKYQSSFMLFMLYQKFSGLNKMPCGLETILNLCCNNLSAICSVKQEPISKILSVYLACFGIAGMSSFIFNCILTIFIKMNKTPNLLIN